MGSNRQHIKKPVELQVNYEERRAWDRLEQEGPQAYRGFCIYRDHATIDRTLVQAFREYIGDKNRKVANHYFVKWYRKYRWRERAQLYDDYLEAMRRHEMEDKIKKAAARHVTQCVNFGVLLNKIEKAVLKRITEDESLKEVALNDLISQAVRGAGIVPKLQEAEMTALGKPKRVEVTGEGGGPLLVRYIPPVVVDSNTPIVPEPSDDEDPDGEKE